MRKPNKAGGPCEDLVGCSRRETDKALVRVSNLGQDSMLKKYNIRHFINYEESHWFSFQIIKTLISSHYFQHHHPGSSYRCSSCALLQHLLNWSPYLPHLPSTSPPPQHSTQSNSYKTSSHVMPQLIIFSGFPSLSE